MKDIKNKVLQQLIDLMDSKEVDGLKSKSPKFMKVETNDPEVAKEVVGSALDMEDPSKELSKSDISEDVSEGEDPLNESDDMERMHELMSKKRRGM